MARTALKYGTAFASAIRQLVGKRGYTPIRTGARRGITPSTREVPPMPDWFRAENPAATEPEWAIYWGHLQLGLKPGVDFIYQYPVDALIGAGKSQVDFYEPDLALVIEVQGIFYHFGLEGAQFQDHERRDRLEALGYQVIFIDEHDALDDPTFYVRAARVGREFSAFARGGF
jgi:very-short-patch-repair endonuclease